MVRYSMTIELTRTVQAQLQRMDLLLFLDYVQDKLADRFYGLQTSRAFYYYQQLTVLTNERILRELRLKRDAFHKGIGKELYACEKLLKRYNPNGSNTQKAKLLTAFLNQYAMALAHFMNTQKETSGSF